MGAIKHQQKLIYELFEYVKQKIMIKDENSMLIGRYPFPQKHYTLNNANIARNSIKKWLSVI